MGMAASVKHVPEMPKVSSTGLCSRNSHSNRSLPEPWEADTVPYKPCFQAQTMQRLSLWVSDSQLSNLKVRHRPQDTEDWSEQHRGWGDATGLPERSPDVALQNPGTGTGGLRWTAGRAWGGTTLMLLSCCSDATPCLTLCEPMDGRTPVSSVLHYLPELAQTHVHRVSDAI